MAVHGGVDLPHQRIGEPGERCDQKEWPNEEPRIEVQTQYDRCESSPRGVGLGLAGLGPILGICHGILVG